MAYQVIYLNVHSNFPYSSGSIQYEMKEFYKPQVNSRLNLKATIPNLFSLSTICIIHKEF